MNTGKINNSNIHGTNYSAGTNATQNNANDNPLIVKPQLDLHSSKNDIATQPVNRLNALDSSLLEDNAYKNIDDEAFKSEYKIDKLESELKNVNKMLSTAEVLNDTNKIDVLTIKKHALENELQQLYGAYHGADITRKLSGDITSLISPKKNIFDIFFIKVGHVFSTKILPKLSKKYSSGQNLQLALDKLQNINKNVTELVSNQAPYGEAEDKYEQLTKYLSKANTIQYKVSKELSEKNSNIQTNPFATQTSKKKSIQDEKAQKLKAKKNKLAKKNALNLNNNISKS